jgi:hypothetical protein
MRKDWVLTERKRKIKGKTKTTKNARSFIQRHIKKHIADGMEQKRAVAAAYSEARKKATVFQREKSDNFTTLKRTLRFSSAFR